MERPIIREGNIPDDPFIGKTITEAMGSELCIGLAAGIKGNKHKILIYRSTLILTISNYRSLKYGIL